MPDDLSWSEGVLFSGGELEVYNLAFERRILTVGNACRQGSPIDGGIRRGAHTIKFSQGKLSAQLMLDTGASRSVLHESLAQELIEGEKGVTATFFRGINGRRLEAIRVETLMSGDFVFRNAVFLVTNNPVFAQTHRRGLFGLDNMQVANWSFNKGRAASMQFDEQGVQWFSLGVKFRHDDGGSVYALAEGGAAEQAGVKLGDRVKSLNNVPADTANVKYFTETASCNCAENAVLTLLRGRQEVSVTIRKKPLI